MFRSKAAGSTIGRFPWEGLSLSFIGCDTNNSRLTFHRGNWLPPSRSRQTKVESHFPLAAGWKRLFTFYFSAMGPGIEVKRCIYRGLYVALKPRLPRPGYIGCLLDLLPTPFLSAAIFTETKFTEWAEPIPASEVHPPCSAEVLLFQRQPTETRRWVEEEEVEEEASKRGGCYREKGVSI